MLSDSYEYRQDLIDAAQRLSVNLSSEQISQLLDYLALLFKWNQAFNLTAVRDMEEMLWRHLVDSLSIVPHIDGQHILDVGTGPGLPGIPLAIIFPQRDFSLLDSNSKKTRFLTQAVMELGLKNVSVHHARVEKKTFDQPFDQIVSRAFASLDKMVMFCHKHLAEDGQFLGMKGQMPEEEIEAIQPGFEVTKCHTLDVPGCEGQRHLIIIEPIRN